MIDSQQVTNPDGTPKWRMAPSPHGIYWREGMKTGYQDCGAWTFLRSTPPDNRAAAWLYAQFVVSKTVSLKKSIEGLTFIRDSDIRSDYFTENAWRYGGLIEFYRSPARVLWSPTGVNVPEYPKLAPLWFLHIGSAVRGAYTAQEALDNLAAAQDEVMADLESGGEMARCAPKLNEENTAEYWFDQPGSPYPKLDDEEGEGLTVSYYELLTAWEGGASSVETTEDEDDTEDENGTEGEEATDSDGAVEQNGEGVMGTSSSAGCIGLVMNLLFSAWLMWRGL
jgi:glycerol transport system substrate-binding protein